MESAVLVLVEEVRARAVHTNKAFEVGRPVYVDTADATEGGNHVADARGPTAETECPTAEAVEQVEVANFASFEDGTGVLAHGMAPKRSRSAGGYA